jgi:hypothetical protein
MLDATAAPFTVNGVGAPTVVYDDIHSMYFMVFEARLEETDPACPVGIWGLGLAWSSDAVNWTAFSEPILTPEIDTFYSCVAAHPTASFDSDTGSIYVYFKSEQTDDVSCEAAPAWGCEPYTGVGVARISVTGPDAADVLVSPEPVLPISVNMGFPKFAAVGDTQYLQYTVDGTIRMASAKDRMTFTPAPGPVIEPGTTEWTMDEVFNPALVCTGTHPILYSSVGGRDNDGGLLSLGGWGRAESNSPTPTTPGRSGLSWTLPETTYFTWTDADSWRHWEVNRLVGGAVDEYVVYFSERNELGLPEIGMATTAESWSGLTLHSKQCL